MRGGGGGEGGLGRRRSSPELVLSVSMAADREMRRVYTEENTRFLVFQGGLFFVLFVY